MSKGHYGGVGGQQIENFHQSKKYSRGQKVLLVQVCIVVRGGGHVGRQLTYNRTQLFLLLLVMAQARNCQPSLPRAGNRSVSYSLHIYTCLPSLFWHPFFFCLPLEIHETAIQVCFMWSSLVHLLTHLMNVIPRNVTSQLLDVTNIITQYRD